MPSRTNAGGGGPPRSSDDEAADAWRPFSSSFQVATTEDGRATRQEQKQQQQLEQFQWSDSTGGFSQPPHQPTQYRWSESTAGIPGFPYGGGGADQSWRSQERLGPGGDQGQGPSRKRGRGARSAAAAQQLIQAWHDAALRDNGPNLTPCLSDDDTEVGDTTNEYYDPCDPRQPSATTSAATFGTKNTGIGIDRPTRNRHHQMSVRRGTEDSLGLDDLAWAKKDPFYDEAGVLGVTDKQHKQSSVSTIELEDMAAGRSGFNKDPFSDDEEEEVDEEQQKKRKAIGLGGDTNLGAAGTAAALGATLGAAYVFKDQGVAAAAAEGAGQVAEELGGAAAEELGGAAMEELGGAAAEELGGAAAAELGGAAMEEVGAEGLMYATVKARVFADRLLRKMRDDEEDDDGDNEAVNQIQEQAGDQGYHNSMDSFQVDMAQPNTTSMGPAPGQGPPPGAEQLAVAQAMLSQAASGIASSAAGVGGAVGAAQVAAAAAATAGVAGKACIVRPI